MLPVAASSPAALALVRAAGSTSQKGYGSTAGDGLSLVSTRQNCFALYMSSVNSACSDQGSHKKSTDLFLNREARMLRSKYRGLLRCFVFPSWRAFVSQLPKSNGGARPGGRVEEQGCGGHRDPLSRGSQRCVSVCSSAPRVVRDDRLSQAGLGGLLTIPGRKGQNQNKPFRGEPFQREGRPGARRPTGSPRGRGKPASPSEASWRFSHPRAGAGTGTGFPSEYRGRGAARGWAAGSGAPCRRWAGLGRAASGLHRAARGGDSGRDRAAPRGPLTFLLS